MNSPTNELEGEGCYMDTTTGEWKCIPPEESIIVPDIPFLTLALTALWAVLGKTGQPPANKLALAIKLVILVFKSPVDDACVPAREKATLFNASSQLGTEPIAICLQRWSSKPGDVLGAYFDKINEAATAARVRTYYETPDPPC